MAMMMMVVVMMIIIMEWKTVLVANDLELRAIPDDLQIIRVGTFPVSSNGHHVTTR